MRRAWYPALVVLLACRLDVAFDESRFYCGGGESCPASQSCVNDYCVAGAPPDAGPANLDASPGVGDAGLADASPDDASLPAAPDAATPDAGVPCLVGNVADDFADGARAPFWQAFLPQPPATASETGGRLVITLAVGVAGSRYAGYTYVHDTDARGQRVQLEVVKAPNGASQANAFFKLQNGSNFNHQASFLVQGGQLSMDTADADSLLLSHEQIAYSATAHRFWALEENDGSISFLTSPDGAVWTLREQQPVPFDFASARVSLGAGTWQAEASPGSVQLDNLNFGPATDCFGVRP